jgi:hypothetical protein
MFFSEYYGFLHEYQDITEILLKTAFNNQLFAHVVAMCDTNCSGQPLVCFLSFDYLSPIHGEKKLKITI